MGKNRRLLAKMASLRFMRRVTVQIYPFQKCTVVPRTLYNMLSTNKALESNPACKPELQVLDTYSPASVRVEWDDNSVSEFNAEKYSVQDMINSLNQKRSLLEFAADVK